MKNMYQIIIALILFSFSLTAQEDLHSDAAKNDHHHHNTIRIAGLIGHTLIKSEGSDSHIFVPSWGFDIEYWFSDKWGMGLHNDLEIESFIIKTENSEEIERVNPLVITFDLLYHLHNGIVLSVGPGAEIEQGKSYYLFRMGVEYEKEIGQGFDICPAFFYDQRFDGFNTYTIALGIGKRF